MEGIDVAASHAIADGFVVDCYVDRVEDVARSIDHVAGVRERVHPDSAELSVALTLWQQHHASEDDLAAKAVAARDAGARRLALYNYSTATERAFSWVPAAVAAFTADRP